MSEKTQTYYLVADKEGISSFCAGCTLENIKITTDKSEVAGCFIELSREFKATPSTKLKEAWKAMFGAMKDEGERMCQLNDTTSNNGTYLFIKWIDDEFKKNGPFKIGACEVQQVLVTRPYRNKNSGNNVVSAIVIINYRRSAPRRRG